MMRTGMARRFAPDHAILAMLFHLAAHRGRDVGTVQPLSKKRSLADALTPNDHAGDPGLRAQLSKLNALFVSAMLMFERSTDAEILHLAMGSVASLGSCQVVAGYVARDGQLVRVPFGESHEDPLSQVMDLGGPSGPLTIAGQPWARALPLRSFDHELGYLVISAAVEPPDGEQFLLRGLTQQTAAALANAHLRSRDRAQATELRTLNLQLAALNGQLEAMISDLERQSAIYETLSRLPITGNSEQGVADTMHALTRLPAVVEDVFGNLRAWAGPGEPVPYPKANRQRRDALLRRADRAGQPLRDRDRLVALAQHHGDVLGLLALVDPDETVDQHEIFALEHGATVLALSMAHARSIAETELRLRRDLLDDLLDGDDGGAFARAAALGHDLHDHHWVVVVRSATASTDAVLRAVERTAADLGMPMLLGRRSGAVVMVIKYPDVVLTDLWQRFHEVLAERIGSAVVGVGGQADAPHGLARSFEEANRAMAIRESSRTTNGITVFDELGLYRLIAPGDRTDETQHFTRQWIGPLVDYDAAHGADLVHTLSAYLESGGSHNAAAEELVVHRSTVRYRLQRIRELTNADLADPDTRFNLQVATRAWRMINTLT